MRDMRRRLQESRDLHLERMFETRSEAWERAGLRIEVNQRDVRRARGAIAVLLPALIAVLVLYAEREPIFGIQKNTNAETAVQWGAVLLLLLIGWTLARMVGRAARPTFFRRMDPGTAGTVGFVIRLMTIAITVLLALGVAGVSAGSLIAGGAFTAVVLGLAAQQTLGNLFAGMVLISARPFRVGERIRLQAGALGGVLEGVVSSLGLLYTTLARGEDRIMIPNTGVLAAVVVPVREPSSVDVRIRLSSGVRLAQVQKILDDQIRTATRSPATVLLEEVDGDDLVIRVRATPEHAGDGAELADEIIAALASVTGRHDVVQPDGASGGQADGASDGHPDGASDDAAQPATIRADRATEL
jgi:small conductance mechanosensitive channel